MTHRLCESLCQEMPRPDVAKRHQTLPTGLRLDVAGALLTKRVPAPISPEMRPTLRVPPAQGTVAKREGMMAQYTITRGYGGTMAQYTITHEFAGARWPNTRFTEGLGPYYTVFTAIDIAYTGYVRERETTDIAYTGNERERESDDCPRD